MVLTYTTGKDTCPNEAQSHAILAQLDGAGDHYHLPSEVRRYETQVLPTVSADEDAMEQHKASVKAIMEVLILCMTGMLHRQSNVLRQVGATLQEVVREVRTRMLEAGPATRV